MTVYTPNAHTYLVQRTAKYEDDFSHTSRSLVRDKTSVFCGDLNVAHKENRFGKSKTNTMNAGFTKEECAKFDRVVNNDLVDAFRYLYPDTLRSLQLWSYMGGARARNVGWRIDYFVISITANSLPSGQSKNWKRCWSRDRRPVK